MPSRRLQDLHPEVQARAQEFLARCTATGVDILVTCTYRSGAEQSELYEQGRTKPGRIVTWERAGESKHNAVRSDGTPAALAFDVVPLRLGKPVWATEGKDGELWLAVGEIGEACGLSWAGRWPRNKREFPHFQLQGA